MWSLFLGAVGWVLDGTDRESTLLNLTAVVLVLLGMVSFFTLACAGIEAPYGRYSTAQGWGPPIPGKVAWVLQESPMLITATLCFAHANPHVWAVLPNKILFLMLCLHYVHRSIIFPLSMRGGKPTPLSLMLMAWTYCTLNGYVQSRHLTQFSTLPDGDLFSSRFWFGVVVFFAGMAINIHADYVLINLRKLGDAGYHIPHGGMFEYVSGANFFGEIVEWAGFAIAGWSVASCSFAIFTFCNIGPRGVQHHQWYLKTFKDKYPRNRKGVIPFVW